MTMRRKFMLLAVMLLIVSGGLVLAQSSTHFVTQRWTLSGGGTAASTNYAVTSTFGQAATDVVDSASYKVSGGFLLPHPQSVYVNKKVFLPITFRK